MREKSDSDVVFQRRGVLYLFTLVIWSDTISSITQGKKVSLLGLFLYKFFW